MVTVIATGFNNHKYREDSDETQHITKVPKREVNRRLGEQINVSLSEQKNTPEEMAPEDEKPKPNILIDDDNPVIYGNDIEIPAFIRRQHE